MNIAEACKKAREKSMAVSFALDENNHAYLYPTTDSGAGTLLWVKDHWVRRWEPNYEDLTRNDYELAELPAEPTDYYSPLTHKWCKLEEFKKGGLL